MCSGPESGSYLRIIDLVYHSTLSLRVIKKREGHGSCSVQNLEDVRGAEDVDGVDDAGHGRVALQLVDPLCDSE